MIALLSFLAVLHPGQTPPSAKAKMAELSFLVGTWQGSGWQARGEDKDTFNGTEVARFSAGETALVIEGHQFGTVNGSAGLRERYNGLVVITWNAEKSCYRMAQQFSTGSYVEYEGRLVDGALLWKVQENLSVSLQVKDGEWLEQAFLTNGEDKTVIFELTMKKKSEQ